MNVYHFWGTADGRELVSVNGQRLMPAPAGTGNMWQRYALILLQHEYRQRPPVNHLLLAHYLPAGRPISPESMPPLFGQNHVGNVLELTSDDLAVAVARVEQVESHLSAVDDAHLTDTVKGPDYRLANALVDAGVKPGRKSLSVLAEAYKSNVPEQSRFRREMLRTLLRGGLDPCSETGGKTLLHHLCAGSAPAQDIRLLLDTGANDVVNCRDEAGDTPLHSYCRRKHAPRPNRTGLKLLLDHGADPHIENNWETPYTLLLSANDPLAGLLDCGAEQSQGQISTGIQL